MSDFVLIVLTLVLVAGVMLFFFRMSDPTDIEEEEASAVKKETEEELQRALQDTPHKTREEEIEDEIDSMK